MFETIPQHLDLCIKMTEFGMLAQSRLEGLAIDLERVLGSQQSCWGDDLFLCFLWADDTLSEVFICARLIVHVLEHTGVGYVAHKVARENSAQGVYHG